MTMFMYLCHPLPSPFDDPHLSSRRKCRVTSTEPCCNRSMLHNLAAELNWPKCGFFYQGTSRLHKKSYKCWYIYPPTPAASRGSASEETLLAIRDEKRKFAGPVLRALLFGCGGGAVLGQTASFRAGSESNVRHWGPWPAGPVRPSGPCCFGVASAPCVSLGGWKTGQRASFLVGSESNVRQWRPWPAGPVRPSGPCCFGVAKAPFVSLGGWKTDSSES